MDYRLEQSLAVKKNRSLIFGVNVFVIFASIGFAIWNALNGISNLPMFAQITGSALMLVLVKTVKSYRLVAFTFVAHLILSIVVLILYFRNFPYTVVLWFSPFTISCLYLINIRIGSALALVGNLIFMIVFYYRFEIAGPGGTVIPEEATAGLVLVGILLASALTFTVALLFALNINRLLTKAKLQNEKLSTQQAILKKALKEKEMLISLICHDIASPLLVVRHFAGKHSESEQETDARTIEDSFSKINKSAQMIQAIIENVRQLHILKDGKSHIELGPVDVRSAIEKLELVFQHRLQAKGLSLQVDCVKCDTCYVLAEDSSLANHVLSNLISNAIKFSEPNKTIVIRIENRKNKVFISITNFGIGIPQENAQHLFTANQAVSSKGTLGEKGTGHGLSIVKSFMDMYGGEIRLSSSSSAGTEEEGADQGTTFQLSFNKCDDEDSESPHYNE